MAVALFFGIVSLVAAGHYKHTPWWALLGFVLSLIFVLAALFFFIAPWLSRRSPSAETVLAESAPGSQGAASDPLTVKIIGEPRWEAWRHLVLLLAANIEVTNTTDSPILVAGYGFTYDAPGGQLWDVGLNGDEVAAIDREVYARQNDAPYRYGPPLQAREIPAHATVSGWRIWAVTRQAGGGTPRCTVVVTDDVGNQYAAVIPAQEPRRVYPW
jgi:hypothetical protein